MSHHKQFRAAEEKYLEAIEIKKKAFTENSIAVCITLSNLADLYLSWKKYDMARETANRMLAAAMAIKSNEQQRIAKEILFDIAKESGVKDSNAGLRQNKVKIKQKRFRFVINRVVSEVMTSSASELCRRVLRGKEKEKKKRRMRKRERKRREGKEADSVANFSFFLFQSYR